MFSGVPAGKTANVVEGQFAKTFGEPGSAGTFSERRSGDSRHFQLPLGELRFLSAKPVEGGANFGRGGKARDFVLKRGMNIRHFAAGT